MQAIKGIGMFIVNVACRLYNDTKFVKKGIVNCLGKNLRLFSTSIVLFMLLAGCNLPVSKNNRLSFRLLNSSESGIDFTNTITENDSVNLVVNEYAYMGGGVGIIDVNNDGLQDVFFTGSQQSCRLYLNEGRNHFRDITASAGVATTEWCTGVNVVDINNDGFDDLYVSVGGNTIAGHRKNLLFINNKKRGFTSEASAYGLADTGYSTQAAFFDMDKDGDLDMYLVNHVLHGANPNNIYPKNLSGKSPLNDKLFENTGTDPSSGIPVYKDVSLKAGIKEDGYGLGLTVSDFNNDGWPDIYVTNDYLSNDLLWVNNKNGTFTNCIAACMNHQGYSSMGVDAADINNDLLPDVITLDMQPQYNKRKKEMFSFLNYERYEMERQAGYEPEFMRNMLQLNNGNISINDTLLPRFSEIGRLAGISETDWSWSVLMADFNNDGRKDVHITNGIGRDLINTDFVMFRSSIPMGENGRSNLLQRQLAGLGSVPLENYLYQNNGDYSFSEVIDGYENPVASISNGAAYADLDNDGDLDLVVNNIDQPAFILANNARSKDEEQGINTNYLEILLTGDSANRHAIGARIFVASSAGTQIVEESPCRGYASSVDTRLFFGLGSDTLADIKIIWPDGKENLISATPVNQFLHIDYNKQKFKESAQQDSIAIPLFTHIPNEFISGNFLHRETFFNDYAFQRLLPQKYSQLGPLMSVEDINGDGLQDIFVGGAFRQSGSILLQKTNQHFEGFEMLPMNKPEEDMGSLFFDADGDGDKDLLVAGGSSEYDEGSKYLIPRFYRNNGKGDFTIDYNVIPASVNTNAQAVLTIDFDKDGDLDIFIGGRATNRYPVSPRSFILENNAGKFSDVTSAILPELDRAGMITAAIASDVDKDGYTDLLLAGEWMPVHLFKNIHGTFKDISTEAGFSGTNGQWRSLTACDVDNDGDVDFIAGNLGQNNNFHCSKDKPMILEAADLDGNGSLDPVMGYYIRSGKKSGDLYPSVTSSQLAMQVPLIKKQYLYARDFAAVRMNDLFGQVSEDDVIKLYTYETASCWFENDGKANFTKHLLPTEAQFSPLNACLATDIDGDGKMDLLIAGNEYQADVSAGRYDASWGAFFKGNGKGNFIYVPPVVSGFAIRGDVKDLKLVKGNNEVVTVVASVNSEKLQFFKVNRPKH